MKEYNIFNTYGMEADLEALTQMVKEDYELADIHYESDSDLMYNYFENEWNDFQWTAEHSYPWSDCEDFVISANLGLWYGNRETSKEVRGLMNAIYACINCLDEFRIYEDSYGNLKIEGYHHDGRNTYTIKRKTGKGLRCVRYRKEVWGC